MTFSKRALAVCGAVVALAASGCAGGGTAQSGGDAFKVGVITSVGSSLTNYPDVEAGARAAVDTVNKAGGVNGKPVELFFCNTRGEVNQAVACSRQADEEGVDAVVGRVDIYSAQTLPVLEKAEIPDIGLVSTGSEIDYTSPFAFPLHGGTYGAYATLPYAAQADGAKSYVFATIDLPIGIRQADTSSEIARNIGLDVKPVIKIPAQGVTDYAPYAQQVKDSGAEAVTVALGPAGLQAFVKAADAIGLQARITGTAFTFGQSEAAGIGALSSRMLVAAPFPSTDDKAVPGIATYNQELDAAGVEQSPALRRFAGLNAWLSAHAAMTVAESIDGDVTRATMKAALEKAAPMDLHGLTTYDPASLTGQQGAFARFPKAPFHSLTFQGAVMVDAGQPEVPDPFATVRGSA